METHYDGAYMWGVMTDAMIVVRESRAWYANLRHNYDMHPAVRAAVFKVRPRDWQQLILEHPHRSVTDPNRLAYTRDERAGMDDKQTVTTIGKYLARHFDLPDHEIRDIVAMHTCNDKIEFIHDLDEMIFTVNQGPNSCMKWDTREFVPCADGVSRHPYAVYDPEYGWHMARRVTNTGSIDGRALCVTDRSGDKYFVRSFKRGESYSHSDESLEAWLKAQGYEHRDAYDCGQKIAYHKTRHGDVLAPYIDGDTNNATLHCDGYLKLTDDSGDYELRETSGVASETRNISCDDCGEGVHEEDAFCVGVWEDRYVCSCCRDSYVESRSRNGRWRHIHEDSVVYVESQAEHFDTEFLSDNNIVELRNGDYEHIDNAICTEAGDWYHSDSCEVWMCASSNQYYAYEDDTPVEIDGELYHTDHAPETTTDEESTQP